MPYSNHLGYLLSLMIRKSIMIFTVRIASLRLSPTHLIIQPFIILVVHLFFIHRVWLSQCLFRCKFACKLIVSGVVLGRKFLVPICLVSGIWYCPRLIAEASRTYQLVLTVACFGSPSSQNLIRQLLISCSCVALGVGEQASFLLVENG